MDAAALAWNAGFGFVDVKQCHGYLGHELLSARERETAELAARGLSNREIARALHISLDTVKKHLTKAMAKTQSASRTQLAMRFQR